MTTEREALEALWTRIKGEPPVAGDWSTGAEYDRFAAMLDAGAYLSAAEMLVQREYPKWAVTGRNSATLGPKNGAPGPLEWVFAETPALALIAAIEQATER